MSDILQLAIEAVNRSQNSFCRFISANDTGQTGSHQSGFYMPKNVVPMMFENPGKKGTNIDRFIKIKWQNEFETDSRFVYYGNLSRNEYRLTRLGRRFPYLSEDNVGDLLILSHIEGENYEGYVLSTDEDIEDFFASFNISPNNTNQLIDKTLTIQPEKSLLTCFLAYLKSLNIDFPSTIELATQARNCHNSAFSTKSDEIIKHPDTIILAWVTAEYDLFKTIESDRYKEKLTTPFTKVDDLASFALSILNRRKSRAGKSLEHHLAEIFTISGLSYETQIKTEENKTPDFIFPGISEYRNPEYDVNKLTFLASKTTCKDRWRQILNEADRLPEKHLFTLQQGISSNQLKEMTKYGVHLVVPEKYITFFPISYHEKILSLKKFINMVKSKQEQL